MLNLSFSDGSFDAVVDKGTLDALLCRGVDNAQAMVVEMYRILSKGGVFLQVNGRDTGENFVRFETDFKRLRSYSVLVRWGRDRRCCQGDLV